MTAHLDGLIGDGHHTMQLRVYYEDTDFSGAVYHASYLRFMERGRTNYLRLLGTDQRAFCSPRRGAQRPALHLSCGRCRSNF